ncbi:pyrroloquinoline quinone precursor peptide PqqA [Actinomadura roseirufa]|nr:pyrroloquinoline quinone precursor peptide PqqA [Actinomadura roseirufa]
MTTDAPVIENAPAEDPVTRWVTPDYQVVETSLEVTAYFGAEI